MANVNYLIFQVESQEYKHSFATSNWKIIAKHELWAILNQYIKKTTILCLFMMTII